MKIRHSIVTRFALFFTGLIIFSILLSGYLVFNNASRVIIDYSKERIMHTSELAEQSFYALLNEVSNDIAVISNSPTLTNYITEHSNKTTGEVHKLFEVTLKNKKSYFQIRLIGADNGKEIIRLDKINEQVIISNILQEKGNQEYFKEAIKMDKGDFYFSEINLNEEYGVISEPHIPTLRAASPIFDANNTVIGIVIINVDLTKLFGTLNNISGNEFKLYLIDNKGQYLYSPVKSQQFGVQTKTDFNFYNDFNLEPNTILNNGFNQLNEKTKGDVLSYIKELTYFKGLRTLYLVSTIEDNVLMESASLVRKNSIQTLLGVCMLSILISWFFVRFFSKKINKITEAISNYDKGINDMELPVNRKDEIGTLASTFNKMKAKIDSQVSALQTSLEKEKEARYQRDEFLQNMSHEMRTPLNAILGLTKLLHKNAPTDAQIPIINTLERTSNSLAGLVYDVLDHKKLTEGRVQINYEPTNIEDLLIDIYSTYQYEAIQKGLMFNLKVDEKLRNQDFLTDALRLSQIIINLVVNAIKYTHEGTINLSAKLIDEKASLLEIKVTDTGIGILPENIERINDKFFREKDDLSGRYGSYGLGLFIVKQLTVLFGGTLKAESEKGKGSNFCVKVPIVTSLKTEKKLPNKSIVYPKFKKDYKILHIEDDLSTLELMSYIFDGDHIQLIQLNKWHLVVESVNHNKPHIIISDLMLENENLATKLLDWISTKKIACPILLVSASEPEVMSVITNLYFQKPFNIDYLKDIVYKLLGSYEFSAPDFSNIYSNYDHNSIKIIKVLKLLEEEFETYLKRIDAVVKTKDENDWEAILHKLIAHINNLKLVSLSEALPQSVKTVTTNDLENIHNVFAYYLCCIRSEIQINLKD